MPVVSKIEGYFPANTLQLNIVSLNYGCTWKFFREQAKCKSFLETRVLLTALAAGYCYQKLLWAVSSAGYYSATYQQIIIPGW